MVLLGTVKEKPESENCSTVKGSLSTTLLSDKESQYALMPKVTQEGFKQLSKQRPLAKLYMGRGFVGTRKRK